MWPLFRVLLPLQETNHPYPTKIMPRHPSGPGTSRLHLPLLFTGVSGRGRQPFNLAPPAPHEWLAPRVACPMSVPERLELYGEARPKPPTLRRRAPKNTKNPSLCWKKVFWTEFWSLISVSKSISPPILRVPKIGKKRRFDTFLKAKQKTL